MRWSNIRRMLGTATALATAVNGASAQGRAEQVVPLELVQTLVVSGPFDDDAAARVLVGSIPEVTARVVPLPATARIIGSLVYSHSTRSAVAFAASADSVLRMMEQSLVGAGWEKFEPPRHRGFNSNVYGGGSQFCMGDSAAVSLSVRPNAEGGTYLTIGHLLNHEYSVCRMEPPPLPERHESLIPTLLPPAGARSRGGGSGGGGGDHWHAHTQLQTTASIEELLEHYGAQLRAAGWQPGTSAADGALVLQTYRLTDDEGAQWNGLFTVSGEPGASHRFLSVLATRAEVDRP